MLVKKQQDGKLPWMKDIAKNPPNIAEINWTALLPARLNLARNR
jgi:hypothetical protein